MYRHLSVLVLILILGFYACERSDHELPVADFDIQPRFGDSLTVFHFDASLSTDNLTDNFRLKTRWDINADGSWESDFSIKKDFAYRFLHNGTYSVKCEVADDLGNTSSIIKYIDVQEVPRDSLFTDSRDGRSYKAVFLFDRWWMSENLNYGQTILKEETPGDNQVAEKYLFPQTTYDSLFGGFYSWNEATEYGRKKDRGICPEGWRLPIQGDIERINSILWFTNNYAPYILTESSYGLDLPLSGKYIFTAKTWDSQGYAGNFWINHEQEFEKFVTWVRYGPLPIPVPLYQPRLFTDYNPLASIDVLWQDPWGPFTYHKVALPIRCLKDHEIN